MQRLKSVFEKKPFFLKMRKSTLVKNLHCRLGAICRFLQKADVGLLNAQN